MVRVLSTASSGSSDIETGSGAEPQMYGRSDRPVGILRTLDGEPAFGRLPSAFAFRQRGRPGMTRKARAKHRKARAWRIEGTLPALPFSSPP